MKKNARQTIAIAEAEGLKFCGVKSRSKHEFLVFENKEGDQYWSPVHRSADEPKLYYTTSNRGKFRRFALGRTQGLTRMLTVNKNANS